ncbi:MAG: DUF3990 domain-containing protein [Oscillospiraceae bacterium]|nr:DUF3990 domain-containing protein [Oscillospiraceae bacterium]
MKSGGDITTVKTIYHGSSEVIKKPEYGIGNPNNDYGLGFYCTEDLELAKEWACDGENGGFANVYTVNTSRLDVIDLSSHQYSVMHWLAVLVNNRHFSITNPLAAQAKEYLSEFFLPDISRFDVITGYRADDSYFAFAMDFLSNTISLSQLGRAMRLGELGEQFVLKSRKAFEFIQFVRSENAVGEIYYPKRKSRDSQAREQYLKRERKNHYSDGLFMIDILREEMKQDDERLLQK